MTPTTDPAPPMRVTWSRLRSAVSADELRLKAALTVVAAGGLAGWRIALITHGAVLAAAALTIVLSRHLP
jgi:hypothetical protein